MLTDFSKSSVFTMLFRSFTAHVTELTTTTLKKLQQSGVEVVVAFGDNYNDIDMLKCVWMPIAMGNSVEALKLQAKYITKTNNESGIAFAINNYVL